MRRVLPFSVCLLVACGSSGSGATGDGQDANADSIVSQDDTTPNGDDTSSSSETPSDASDEVALGEYPPPPWGNTVGATFPNLQWQGYVDDSADAIANSKPFGPYSMDAVRRSGKRYAFVHVSDFY